MTSPSWSSAGCAGWASATPSAARDLADLLEELIRPDPSAGPLGDRPDRSRVREGRFEPGGAGRPQDVGRLIEQVARLLVSLQECVHAASQLGVAGARTLQVRLALGGCRLLKCAGEDRFLVHGQASAAEFRQALMTTPRSGPGRR
jgi:hypothetical protein